MAAIKLTPAKLRNQIITLVASLYAASRSAVKIKEELRWNDGAVLGYYITVNGTTEEFGSRDIKPGATERQGLRQLRSAIMRRCQRVANNMQSVIDSEDAAMVQLKKMVRSKRKVRSK